MNPFRLLACIGLLGIIPLQAGVMESYEGVQDSIDEVTLELLGERLTPALWQQNRATIESFARELTDPQSLALWQAGLAAIPAVPPANPADTAAILGSWQARLQHAPALEMIRSQRAGDVEAAREWRAVIRLPKHASAVEGMLALQHFSGQSAQKDEVSRLLAREYVVWQSTRARERADDLRRQTERGRGGPVLVALRASEAQLLTVFPPELVNYATGSSFLPSTGGDHVMELVEKVRNIPPAAQADLVSDWKNNIEAGLPDLLTEDDVNRRERLVLKLIRLIPMEYKNGVRDGEVVVPLEYREAQLFTVQAQQMLGEVRPRWRTTKAEALAAHGTALEEHLQKMEQLIQSKAEFASVNEQVKEVMSLLETKFGLSLRKAGKGSDVVAESALEVRTLLTQSMQAARSGKWQQAEALRLEAYTTFDLEIEMRVLPRDPSLAKLTEKRFLEGDRQGPGIKAALDARQRDPELSAAYARALGGLDECLAILKVAISPATVTFTAITIVLREGLEAVVILAALLAGMRGVENARPRRHVAMGAWLALAATVVTFIVSHTLIQSLSRYGETLEAVISILAVIILLMVTNWVFHKVYWVQWNATLRDLRKKVDEKGAGGGWESLAMVGVGFLTIYREGFETTLFMQSLLLEGGWRATTTGLAIGGALIAIMGWGVFIFGAKLPYRRLLVITGVLVVSILVTFIGSTVRLFQTVGWLPVHPVPSLDIPGWMGMWFGLYPSWEGLLIPPLGLVYVGGAWLIVKWQASRSPATVPAEAHASKEEPAVEESGLTVVREEANAGSAIILKRNVQAVRIPVGEISQLPVGSGVVITQALGDSYTVTSNLFPGLWRLSGSDADALGLEPKVQAPVVAAGGEVTEESVWDVLKTCYDPEIPVNIVNLGLIYDMDIERKPEGAHVDVKMTLTAPGCGMGPAIAADARRKILSLPGVISAEVVVVWDPVWTPERISTEGKEKLGME